MAPGKIIRRLTMVVCLAATIISPVILSGCTRGSASVIIAGSTSVQPFAEVLAEQYMILNPGITIDVQGGGSAAGIMAAQSGTADIGMSSRALNADEAKLWYVEIAKDGLAVIIHPDNPITNLTLEQVRDIYSGQTTNWESVGGKKAGIHVFTREDGSGTRAAFESLVMAKTEIMARAMVQDSNGAVRQLVADDSNAIGFISLGLVDKTVKAVELNGVIASREHVLDGSYKLTRPFLFLAAKEPTGLVKEFIDFTLSAAGKKILDTEGLVTTGITP
ncbi:MAG: phosphate ABC transporter substrate-binding protein [Dehalococcoidales bacterium]|nr:phosphate ABC transporter substrate-binding protein [Dehalococcoidales bacterium]